MPDRGGHTLEQVASTLAGGMPVDVTIVERVEGLARKRGWPYLELTPAGTQDVDPSRTSDAGAAALVAELDRLVGEHQALRRRGRTPDDVRRYYARLLGGSREELPATFICELPDALVVGDLGVVVTARGEALVESSLYGGARGLKVELARNAAAAAAAETLPGRFLSLVSFDSRNYAHWLQDCLPRLALLPPGDRDFRVLVSPEPDRHQRESLELLGLTGDRVVPMPAAAVRVERLVLARASARTNRPVAAHLLTLRARLRAAAGVDEAGRGGRLYVSRARERRPVVNEDELASVLAALGFEVVRPGDLPVGEQVRRFAAAAAVAGPHGAGMHNHLFAPEGAAVVEIFGPGYLFLTVQRTAAIAGHRHWHVLGEPAGDHYGVRVDPARVRDVLELALGGGLFAVERFVYSEKRARPP